MKPLPEPRITALCGGAPNRLSGDWPERCCTAPTRAELHSYPCPTAARGRALICAGGGYLQLVHDKEGVEIALWLNSLGLDAHVLLHRLPGQPCQDAAPGSVWPYDIALQDGRRALDHLAGLAPLPLLQVGLSSGGHLAAVLACQSPCAGALIAYAPLNANHRDHKVPAGKPDFAPPEKQAFYDAWPIGLAEAPHGLPRCPLFLAYALHDAIVPVEHALNLLRGMARTGQAVEAHLFPDAAHGFALRALHGAHAQWPQLAERWIDERLAA